MADSLTIFGDDFTGVTGIKATSTGNDTLTYIRPQGTKSITSNGTGIDVSEYAMANVAVPASQPNLQSKTRTISAAGTFTDTPDSGYDGLSSMTTTVPEGEMYTTVMYGYRTQSGARKWFVQSFAAIDTNDDYGTPGFIANGAYVSSNEVEYNAIASGTTVTPTESAQTIGGANVMMEGAVTVNAIPSSYVGSDITRRSSTDLTTSGDTVSVPAGYYENAASKAIAAGSAYVNDGTVNLGSDMSISVNASGLITAAIPGSGVDISITPVTTAGYVSTGAGTPGNITITGSKTSQLSTQAGTTITPTTSEQTAVAAGKYTTGAVKVAAMPSGSVSASATKGTVSNHSVQVTPTATVGTAGYLSAGSTNGSAVTVQASELVSGSETKTENGTYDVTNLAELVVNVSGGGSTGIQIGTKTTTLSTTAQSISFTGLSGNPTSFYVISQGDLSTGDGSVAGVVFDGTNIFAQTVTSQAEYASTGYSKSYSSGTLTITSTGAEFADVTYKLIYTYGGASSDIHTSDVQVGSGATSISFSGLSGRPICWSCVFKSNFSTSSGYQRVIEVANDGSSIFGMCLDSSAHAATVWTATYNGGTLTISSQGTNNGGYFHQPGYYQLTYAVDPNAVQYQAKTGVGASTSSQTIYPDSGYDALESVQINAVSQTNLSAANIKSGTTISISNGTTNLWSVTGTYTGGGGGGASIATTTWTNSSNTATSHQFTGLSGTPIAAFLRCTASLSRSSSSSNYFIADMFWDGSTCKGNSFRRSNGTYANVTSGYSVTTGTNSITFTSSGTSTTNPGSFYNGAYELVYVY